LKRITIRLDPHTIQFFKRAAVAAGTPYQTVINLYLRDCAQQGRKLSIEWRASA
jgi:predicted DNA binding CopG/RHH family protein